VPYAMGPHLPTGDSVLQGRATSLRRHLRNAARAVVSVSAVGPVVGQRNGEFFRHYGAPRIIRVHYSVDDERFPASPRIWRSELQPQDLCTATKVTES
jgi:hypothetical protein